MLYIFDKDDNFKNIITEDTGLIDTWFKDYQNHLIDEPFVFHVDSESELLPLIVAENQVAFNHTFNALQQDVEMLKLMRIKEIDEIYNNDGYIVEVTCEPSWLELYDHFIEDRRIDNGNAQTAISRALDGSRWVGQVAGEFGNGSTNFYWIDAVEALFKIAEEWGGTLQDYITLDENNEIATRIMYLLPRLGRDNGLLIQPGYNAETIERRTLSYPITAMYGQGASLEIEDEEGNHTGGYTRYITFEDVEWKKSKGDPVDKPKGQKWVGDPKALAKYGYLKDDGTRMHRFGHFSNQDYETPEELLWATWEALQKEKDPEVYHEAVIDEVDKPIFLGDTGTILDRHYGKPIEVQSQITGLEYDILEPTKNVNTILGNYKDMSRDPLEDDIDDLKNEVTKPRPTKPIDETSFPDIKPNTPINVEADGLFKSIMITWDYDYHVYVSHYEVYGSQVADFVPDSQFLLWRGDVSSYAHEADNDETWYYRVRAVNTRGTVSDFSKQVSASTVRINTPDIMFGAVKAEQLAENLEIAEKLSKGTIEYINEAPLEAARNALEKALEGYHAAQDATGLAQRAFDDAKSAYEGVGTLQDEFDIFNDNFTSKINDVEEEFSVLHQDFETILGRVEKTEDDYASLTLIAEGLQTQVSNVKGDLSTVTQLANVHQTKILDIEGNVSTLEQTAKSFESRITSIENWEIGGKNLILSTTPNEDNAGEWVAIGGITNPVNLAEVAEGSERGSYFRLGINNTVETGDNPRMRSKYVTKLRDGQTYTVSWKAFHSDWVSNDPYGGIYDNGGIIRQSFRNADKKAIGTVLYNGYTKTVYQYTFTFILNYELATEKLFGIYLGATYTRSTSSAAYVLFKDIKLEEGNKATQWSPAPEDMATQTQISSINQDIGNIGLFVASLQGDLNNVTGQMSLIDQKADNISLSVNKIEGDLENYGVGNRNLFVMSVLEDFLVGWGTAINKKVPNDSESELTCKIHGTIFSGIEFIKIDTVTKDGNELDSVQLDNDKKEGKVLVPSTGNTYLRVAILTNSITPFEEIERLKLKIESGGPSPYSPAPEDQADIIQSLAYINLSEDGIRLHGNKVQITGQTEIENGVIGTAAIADAAIKRAHLQNAIIDTAQMADAAIVRAKIANLAVDNSKIANATITDAKIASLNVDKLTGSIANFVSQGFNNVTSQVSITGMGLETYYSGQRTSLLDGNGHRFYRDNQSIGYIGTASWVGDSSYRGLAFNLENNANYMAWGFKKSANATTYTTMLSWHKTGAKSNKGLSFFDNIHIINGNSLYLNDIRVNGYANNNNMQLTLSPYTFDGVLGVGIRRGTDGAKLHLAKSRAALVNRGNAHIMVGDDSSGNYVKSIDIRNRTSTYTTNMVRVTNTGTLQTSSSSRRYKLQEKPVELDIAKKLLELQAKSWYDKKACESYSQYLLTGKEGEEKEPINRIGGLIAEDVHDVGLRMYVNYDELGRPDGISSNLWTLLIPVTKDHIEKTEENFDSVKLKHDLLKTKVIHLEKRIEHLENLLEVS